MTYLSINLMPDANELLNGRLYQLNSDELERQNYFFSYSSLVVAKRGEFLNLPFLLLSTGIIYFTRASPFSIFQLFNTKTKQ